MADAAVDAITALLVENGRLLGVEERPPRASSAETRAALERSYLRPTYRAREKMVRRLERAGPGAGAAGLPPARGRSSRSA